MWLALVGAIIGAGLGAAFGNMEKRPDVSLIILNVAIPALVVGWIGFCYAIAFSIDSMAYYIQDVLERRIEHLFVESLGEKPPVSNAAKDENPRQGAERSHEPVNNSIKESLNPGIWGWESWISSPEFGGLFRKHVDLSRFIGGMILLIALVLPPSIGYLIFFGDPSTRVTIEAMGVPVKTAILGAPILFWLLALVGLVIGMPLLDRTRRPRICV